MTAVANIFDVNADGFIDYYEFVSALHPTRDPYRKTIDADQINDEVCVALFLYSIYMNYFCKTTNRTLTSAGESSGLSMQLSKEISSRAN